MGFTVKKRVLRRVLRRGSEKEPPPLGEYDPLGVRPTHEALLLPLFYPICGVLWQLKKKSNLRKNAPSESTIP